MQQVPRALAGLLALAAPTLSLGFSQGLDHATLPEDTRWVAHIDIQGLQRSVLFQELMKVAGDEFERDLDFDELREEFGVDPLKDFKSVTIFGSTTREEKAVIMVRATSKLDAILERFREEDAYRSFEVDGTRVHTWEDGGDDQPYVVLHRPRGSEERVAVISNDRDMLLRSVGVLAGRGRSMADSGDPALTARPRPGAFLFVDVAESLSEWGDFEPISKVAELMRSFTLEVGEQRGEAYVKATLETQKGEDARRIADIVNGFRSLIPLLARGHDLPDIVTELLDGLQIAASGTFVTLELTYDSKRLVAGLEQLEDHF